MSETDPCAEATRLRNIRTAIATGRAESLIRSGDEEVRFFVADTDLLDRLIAEADAKCDLATGGARRRRFAKGIRIR
jgi:hypothetical protein